MAKGILLSLLACSLIQVGILVKLIHRGNPGGDLIECLMPPCQRSYPLWIGAAVFTAIALLTARRMMFLVLRCRNQEHASNIARSGGNDALLYSSMAVAIFNVVMDVHYAHPIPHAGKSLNAWMHSNVTKENQAVLPWLTVVLSIAIMSLSVISHRALTDILSLSKRSEDKKTI